MLRVLALSLAVLSLAVFPAMAEDDPVVATVDGAKIMRSDVVAAQQGLPKEYQAYPFDAIFPQLLEILVDAKLAAAEARRSGLMDDEDVKKALARAEEQILQRALFRQRIEAQVTDEALRKRFDSQAAAPGGAEQVHARHILVDSEEEARKVIDTLKGGADFAETAKKFSTGPSGPNGGDLGYFKAEDMVPPFSQAAFAMEVGSFSQDPVRTQFGWHIIKVEDKRAAAPAAFDDVKDKLRAEMSQEIGTALATELRVKAEVTVFNADGSPR